MIEINDNEIGKTEEMNLLIDIQTTIEEHLESLPLGDRDKPFHKDIVAHYEIMSEINIDLHPAQLEIFNSDKRFKIVAAGRRFGKSRLAAWILLIKALQSDSKDVFYIGPTFQQSKDIMWLMLKELGEPFIAAAHENTAG